MLGQGVECLVLGVDGDLNVLRNGLPLALGPCVTTFATTVTVSEAARTNSPALTTVTTWRTTRAITTRTTRSIATRRTARAITTWGTTRTTFTKTATATAVTTVSALRTIFTIGKTFDDLLLLAKIRDPCGHHAQARKIEGIILRLGRGA